MICNCLHSLHVWVALKSLCHHDLFPKPEKCTFDQITTKFIGFILSPEGLKMDTQKVQAIQEWKAPENMKELQKFLGFVNFYWRFIAKFAQVVVAPLTTLPCKNVQFYWFAEAQQGFEYLKQAFTSAPNASQYRSSRAVCGGNRWLQHCNRCGALITAGSASFCFLFPQAHHSRRELENPWPWTTVPQSSFWGVADSPADSHP